MGRGSLGGLAHWSRREFARSRLVQACRRRIVARRWVQVEYKRGRPGTDSPPKRRGLGTTDQRPNPRTTEQGVNRNEQTRSDCLASGSGPFTKLNDRKQNGGGKSSFTFVGVVMGSQSDWETMRHASDYWPNWALLTSRRSSRRIERPSGCFAMTGGRGSRFGGFDCRCGRGSSFAGNAGSDHAAAGTGRAG